MPCFQIVIEYLTGYAVATDPSSRERPEWPPHPARIFMALAAAHFETDGSSEQKQTEREALEWLAMLPPPDLVIPNHSARDVLSVYVPVNDQKGELALLKRSRQPRTFPRVHVGDEPVRLIYRVDPSHHPKHLAALEAVCRNVTRIGHSSSLVWVRVEQDGSHSPTHEPDQSGLGVRFRMPFNTILKSLDDFYGEAPRTEYAKLKERISSLERQIKSIRGKGAIQHKQALTAELNELKKPPSIDPPLPIRPSISHTTSYRPITPKEPPVATSNFDPNFIVLRPTDDSTQGFGLESTVRICEALRGAIFASFGDEPIPGWVSGHEPSGEKLQTGSHLAIVPLAFVGSRYADGHLMGLAILIPKDVPLAKRGRALAGLLFDPNTGDAKTVTLTLGSLGRWSLVRESSVSTKQTLQTRTYTQPSTSWASVTPIVLDRMPKADRLTDPIAWCKEVETIITGSCTNVGLPRPVVVRVQKTPFFLGSLRAMPGQGGFPQLRTGRFQVHVQINFAEPVAGPVLLGAGRFRGYGLMRPFTMGGK